MLTDDQRGVVNRIVALIDNAGMSMRMFTDLLGVHATTVTEWKSGRTRPSVDHVRKIARIFNVSTDYIINGSEKSPRESTVRVNHSAMYKVFSELSDEHQMIVAAFMVECLDYITKKHGDEPAESGNTDAEAVKPAAAGGSSGFTAADFEAVNPAALGDDTDVSDDEALAEFRSKHLKRKKGTQSEE